MLEKLVKTINLCVLPNVDEHIVLSLRNINKAFKGKSSIASNINLDIKQGQIFSILGETGSGKTTILRMIAGFEQPDSGEIIIGHQYAYKEKLILNPEKRGIGIMFQQYTLFPHMNVLKNIEFGVSHLKKQHKCCLVADVIDKLQINDIINCYPYELSGGQQQKVALARILVMKPKIILFDEAFSNLDKNLKISVRGEIRDLVKNNNITAIFVTHDQEEAFALSDQIAVIKDGNILQIDTPRNMYNSPVSAYVACFLGKANFIDVLYKDGNLIGAIDKIKVDLNLIENQQYKLMIRPENINISCHNVANSIAATILEINFLGSFSEIVLNGFGVILKAIHIGNTIFKGGDRVYITFNQFKII